ncbi:hypothetical protein J6590_052287 [Homalodisca vitripennis]|nr:hypothetical protein J6590_052287 [Homalodisca vitripennis]
MKVPLLIVLKRSCVLHCLIPKVRPPVTRNTELCLPHNRSTEVKFFQPSKIPDHLSDLFVTKQLHIALLDDRIFRMSKLIDAFITAMPLPTHTSIRVTHSELPSEMVFGANNANMINGSLGFKLTEASVSA